jgi:hypothetical protein
MEQPRASKPHNQAEWYERLMFAPDVKNEASHAKQDAEEVCLVRESALKKQFPAVRMTSDCSQTLASVLDTVLRTIIARCSVHRGSKLPPVLTPPILATAIRSVCTPKLQLPLPACRAPAPTRTPRSRTPRHPKKSKRGRSKSRSKSRGKSRDAKGAKEAP